MLMGNLKKRHSDKNLLAGKFARTGSKGSLLALGKPDSRRPKRKGFARKSNSLKVFAREPKKSGRMLKNVLSEKSLNAPLAKKPRFNASTKKEKRRAAAKLSGPASKPKGARRAENKENGPGKSERHQSPASTAS